MFPDAVRAPVAPKSEVPLTPAAIPPVPPSRVIAPVVVEMEAVPRYTPQSVPPEPISSMFPEFDEIAELLISTIACATELDKVPVSFTFPEVVEMVDESIR